MRKQRIELYGRDYVLPMPDAGRRGMKLQRTGLAMCLCLAGCNLAPAYRTPVVSVPVSYAEAAPWHPGAPADTAPRGDWWNIYNDPILDRLQARVEKSNPDLQGAVAVYERARAVAAQAEAGLYPSLGIGGRITTNRQSARRPTRGADQANQYMDNAVDTQATYEIDIWGKAANALRAGNAAAAASSADLETMRLSLHAELATEYFTLRGLDAEAALLSRTTAQYEQAQDLTQRRFAGAIDSGMDVARAATQLHDARAQEAAIAARRSLCAHAIATLIGVPPANFTIVPAPAPSRVPSLDPGVPAALLQRRPDIASAERLVAAANAEIGVTRAAFYPNISLNAALGLEDTGFNLFNLPDSFWSVGPGVTLPLFEGGLRDAEENAAVATYRHAIASYKATVLAAFSDVEDQLASLHWLGEQETQENAAADDARQTFSMAMASYKDGAANFLDVVTAQTAELQAERTALEIHTSRVIATVALARALGGGWDEGKLQAT